MAAILVGDDRFSRSFLAQKAKTAQELGIIFELHELVESLSQKEVEAEVKKICGEKAVGGVVIQLPLPPQYKRDDILAQIPLEKDVDDLNGMTRGILPPAPGSLKKILKELNFDLTGKKAIVFGPGFLIGKPVAQWLLGKCMKLTVCDKGESGERDLKDADLIVTSTGVVGLIRGEYIKEGAIIVDYGYGKDKEGKLTGDVDMASCLKKTQNITPTPGGTGPIVVAQLFANFYHLTT